MAIVDSELAPLESVTLIVTFSAGAFWPIVTVNVEPVVVMDPLLAVEKYALSGSLEVTVNADAPPVIVKVTFCAEQALLVT